MAGMQAERVTRRVADDFHLHGDHGLYHCSVNRDWWAQGALHGGYVLALAMTAIEREFADTGMTLRHASLHYLRPFVEGVLRAEVTAERRGRRLATASLRMWSAGELAGVGLGSVARRRAIGEVPLVSAPTVVPYDPDANTQVGQGLTPIHKRVWLQPRIHEATDGRVSRVGGWVALRAGEVIDHQWIAVLVDLWAPAVYHAWQPRHVVTTADLTYHARCDLPLAVQPSGEPVLVVLTNRVSTGGFVDEDVEVWSADGVLLAQSRQMRFVHEGK